MVYSNRFENDNPDNEYVPNDRCNIVFILVMLVGFGVLMPWNMFITIAPEYYVNYWFKIDGNETWYSEKFMSLLTVSSQLPNATINVINLFLIIGGPLIYRVFAPVCFNIFNVGAVLLLVLFVDPSIGGMTWFFWITLLIVMFINFSNGLYENSVFGVFADFPHKYTSGVLIGNNMCGLMISFLKLAVTLLMKEDVKLTAIIYFSISLTILIMCGLALLTITKQEFYHFYHEKGIEIRMKAETHKPSLPILWETFKACFGQLFNVWFTFAITLTVFPVVMTATKRTGSGVIEKTIESIDEVFTLITTFVAFNLFATIGAIAASKVHWPSAKNMVYAVVARALFVPIFFFCNYRPDTRTFPVIIHSTEVYVFAVIAMSFTHGYLSSLAMSYCPKVVDMHHSRFAAQLSACCLMIGLFTGAVFSVCIENLVSSSFF
ncbi:unnamed protein product [Caenorhabditis bovis]|uniref:Uncharacterized protein n=1 Tax=Caenorhabditis bovis TaxID=2654633 RepID=A0A8S1ELX4_9PELO|nr:unnamed protein product [Caenorhabditis bovis]